MVGRRRKETVCVTGASGFIGSHVVQQLLEKGYKVQGTVRDASDEKKCGWLHSLGRGLAGVLRLSSADLTKPGSFDEAIKECDYVCHVAAVVQFHSKNPQKDLVDPTVEGTRNVFNSVLKAKRAKRVVMTSSYLAVIDPFAPNGTVFTEQDWHKEMSLKNPYPLAKTLSEKHAWQVYEEQKARAAEGKDKGWCFELVTLQPTMVLGNLLHPSHGLSFTPGTIQQMASGKYPLLPRCTYPVVHVKDVASAHVRALEEKKAHGRYIIGENKTSTSLSQMARILKEKYRHLPVLLFTLPNWAAYIGSLFHPSLPFEFVKRNAGRVHYISSEKAMNDLKISFTPPKTAVLDTAESCLKHGLINVGLTKDIITRKD